MYIHVLTSLDKKMYLDLLNKKSSLNSLAATTCVPVYKIDVLIIVVVLTILSLHCYQTAREVMCQFKK